LSDLFDQLTNGSGALTKDELEQAVVKAGGTAAQADSLFEQLDTTGSGSVTKDQFESGVAKLAQTDQHAGGAGAAHGGQATSSQTTTKTETNPDGSVTTTVTYPDGTTVTTTTPATTVAGAAGTAASTGTAGSVLGPIDSRTISALFVLLAA
jgi:hypothetical protein